MFKCNKCDQEFANAHSLKTHKKIHAQSCMPLRCDDCEKTFNEEWKLTAHIRTHKKYSCDQCDKSFKFEDTRSKHIKIAHEGLKLYCHYFNNEKDCPFEDKCVFLHENSEVCKYGELCGRNYCMFKHEGNDDSIGSNDDDEEDENDDANETFLKPTQTAEIV